MVISTPGFRRQTDVENEEVVQKQKDLLINRLKRLEGQIRGIEKMISDERDCVSIVVQLAAVRSGVEGAGALVLNNCMKLCFYQGQDDNANIDSLTKAMAIWGRVRGEGDT
jgi:DNA-binding FrmR family transcriptional regulator